RRRLGSRIGVDGTSEHGPDALLGVNAGRVYVRAVRVPFLPLEARVHGREEVARGRVDSRVSQRRADPGRVLDRAGIRAHQAPATVTPRSTVAAFVFFSATPTGPSSTSPVFTAPEVEKSGSQDCTSWEPTVVTPWKPSIPTRYAYRSVAPAVR